MNGGGKIPGVSIVGVGKSKAGFEPLPSSEPPALAAARKSRQHKNRVLLKIGGIILLFSAALASLAAFLLTRGDQTVLVDSEVVIMENRIMNDKLTALKEVEAVASGNKVFSGRLYNLLREKEGNIIFSPFSVSGVMAMVTEGAGGDTLMQLTQGMSFPDKDKLELGYKDVIPALRTNENFTLEAANSIFCQAGFNLLPNYQETLHQMFHAGIQVTDFSDTTNAAHLINDWVKTVTRDKIKHLINKDMLNALTRLVLVNAIYFKGDWEEKFDSKRTNEQTFHLSDGSTKNTLMMHQTRKFPYAELSSLEATMVEMPYKGDRLVMQILLPKDRQGLGALEDKLRTEDVAELFNSEKRTRKVSLKLPKFKLEQRIPLTNHLRDLGMRDMLVGGVSDLSGIDGSKQLYVSTVIQKAFIEVNEEGSEAAAATGAVLMMRSMPLPPEEFHADHPFLFYLKDKLTGMLLFQGRVADPSI